MHTRILTFHNLIPPHLDGDREGRWCTYSKEDGMVYLLNGNRHELAALSEIDITTDIHFESEEECHKHAEEYYDSWCRQYPYMAAWQASKAAVVPEVNKTTESQVMEFI